MVNTISCPKTAVILVGHGAVPKDFPRDQVTRLKALEGRRQTTGEAATLEEIDLDHRVRSWPRTPATDPYQTGFETLAASLSPLLPGVLFKLAYLEFCNPTLEETVDEVVAAGATTVLVAPSMLTPGGVHSEVDIPQILLRLREQYPTITLRYAWPFDMTRVAHLLAEHLQQFT
jgi:sirohydrochlorin cobaltochelatase